VTTLIVNIKELLQVHEIGLPKFLVLNGVLLPSKNTCRDILIADFGYMENLPKKKGSNY
jgi:hypothetical protein